ncbi:MAG: winged helix-turn-helix domain-containing protein [Rubrivivax sp.]
MTATVDPRRLRFGQFEFQPTARVLLADDAPLVLGSRAFDVLSVLVEQRARVVSKNELLDRVWPTAVVEENTLQVHVSALRKLLGAAAITTVSGHGYRFTAAVEGEPSAGFGGAVAQSTPTRHNLPAPRNRFIGRGAALDQCENLLLQHARLLTLTGIGGCGKTRMALQLAERLLPSFADGVWFIDLAPWQAPQHVAAALANAIGVREEAGTPTLERLAAHLGQVTTLLVLDNCEHLIDAVSELVDTLLASCPWLKVVTTSRQSLGLKGEQIFPVPPLTLPDAADLVAVQDCESVRLFVDRAASVHPGFHIDAGNAAPVTAICLQLDGTALAIELAAARTRMLSVTQINERLADRFKFLVGASHALPRHQTLQATLHWSHDSLSPQEQQLFRELAVFAGGCTLAAATQVSAASDASDASDEYRVLALLTRLHDKSLLVVDHRAQMPARYRMLETVRQYAQQRLDESGAAAAVRDRHLVHFLALSEQASTQLQGPQQGMWMSDLAADQDNLLAAHDWCLRGAREPESGLRLFACLWRYWVASGQLERGHALADAALAGAPQSVASSWHGRASWAAGQIAFRMGRYAESLAHADTGLRIAVTQGDAEQVAANLGLRAKGLQSTGRAREALLQYEQACAVARTLENTAWLGNALNNLAELHRGEGNLGCAQTCYEEAIGIARRRQSPEGIFVPLCNLARLSLSSGDSQRAQSLLLESLELASGAELKGMGEDVLEVAAGLASERRQFDQAARFAGAALARMRESGSQREPVDEAFVAPFLDRACSALGQAEFNAAQAEGGVWGHEVAILQVRRWLEAECAC